MEQAEFWNAFGAIGQWAGALGTFIAVYIALNADKPKYKIVITEPTNRLYPNIGYPPAKVLFVNRGRVLINIIEID